MLPPEVGAAMDSDGIPSVVSQRYSYWDVRSPNGQAIYNGFFPSSSKPNAMVETFVSKGHNADLKMSEVAFQTATWARYGGDEEEVKQLEYIYKPQIVNKETQSIMEQAHERSCEKGDPIVFKPDTDEIKALLGTPNVAIAAHMLIEHAEFFQKTVTETRLYLERNMMVFRLG